MKYSNEMLVKIDETLEECRKFIEEKQLIKLNSTFSKFSSSFSKLFLTLSTEKIINVDPYGEDYNLKELGIPDQSEIPYNEEEYYISIRFTHYSSLLNYIKDNNIISIDFLTPDKFQKLEQIVEFLDWDRVFDPQPMEINTEAINKVLFNFQKEHDPKYIIESLKASTKDINIYKNQFMNEVETVKLFINEKYKHFIRQEVLGYIKLPPEIKGENIKKAHDLISKKVKELGIPLYIELIGEVLNEDFSSDGEELREKIQIELLNIDSSLEEKRTTNKESEEIDPIEMLQNSIIELSKTTSQMDSILEKISENMDMYRVEKYSIIEKFIDYIKYTILTQKRVTNLNLEVKNSSDEKLQKKNVEFEKFIGSLKALDKRFNSYKTKNNKAFLDLFEQEEDDIKSTIHQLLSKCRYNYKILIALDKFYKSNLSAPKGIIIELKVYLSALDKGQELYFEYTKLKSENTDETTYKPGINLTT